MHLLCRNRVVEFTRWKAIFDSHADAHRAHGLDLVALWRETGDPDNVFFLFAVHDPDQARAFVAAPEAAAAGAAAGVLEGELHFLESAPGYGPTTAGERS